ncbi:tetratricopeptide repeat protein [Cytobacillus sp. FJAT-54145]|uniref:Tetratricopeptide repeat protein n=1 Tax=Cytobacillus spartinae TaxID=3299023 RepID=A0ABW6KGN4_9BACI
MKKREPLKKDGNVIHFPDLEKRFLERGLESLQNKKYNQAVEYLEEAKRLDPSNSDIYIGLVLSYYEVGRLHEAKQLTKEMLKEGIGNYIQTVDLYLMILVQLHEYEEIVSTIEVLLEESEVPIEKYEHFSKMLEFSRRMVEGRNNETYEEEFIESEESTLNLLETEDPKKLMLQIAELTNQNIRPYIDEVASYLESNKGHPFLKTMLLNILKEQEVSQDIKVEKFGWVKIIKPRELGNLQDVSQVKDIEKHLKDHLENEDPILFQHVVSIVERQFFLLYPFDMSEAPSNVWAAAYHTLALEYHGMNYTLDQMSDLYGTNPDQLSDACEFIKKLEEISYPII